MGGVLEFFVVVETFVLHFRFVSRIQTLPRSVSSCRNILLILVLGRFGSIANWLHFVILPITLSAASLESSIILPVRPRGSSKVLS